MNIRPSSAKRWVNCPGSAALEAQFPDDAGTAAIEGTTAHEVAELVLMGKYAAPRDLVGEQMSTGVTVTDEMALHVSYYVSVIREQLTALGIEDSLVVERTLPIPHVHPDMEGTPDAWAYDVSTSTLYIWDLKYGWGLVEAEGNLQMSCYVLAALNELIGTRKQAVKNISVTIVQPRPWHPDGPLRPWNVSTAGFKPVMDILWTAAQAAMTPGAHTRAADHCLYCNALHACPAARVAGHIVMDIVGTSQPDTIDPEAIGAELTLLRRAEAAVTMRKDAMESLAMSIAEKGGVIPGYKMSHGRGKRVYTQPDAVVIAIGASMNVNMQETSMLSPNKAHLAGIPTVLLESFVKTIKGKPKLVVGDAAEDVRRTFDGK